MQMEFGGKRNELRGKLVKSAKNQEIHSIFILNLPNSDYKIGSRLLKVANNGLARFTRIIHKFTRVARDSLQLAQLIASHNCSSLR